MDYAESRQTTNLNEQMNSPTKSLPAFGQTPAAFRETLPAFSVKEAAW
ncbi:hypothetical protein M2133_003000 [Parabacteroides sp. PF5-6]|nr:hypothetical protein [Parabacteroides sp. PF5-6]